MVNKCYSLIITLYPKGIQDNKFQTHAISAHICTLRLNSLLIGE